MGVLRRFLFWEYPRAGWQYDVIVGLILVFIFATPREIFRDQPKASNIVMLAPDHGSSVYFLEPDLLAGVPETGRVERASALVREKAKARKDIERVVPIFDVEDEIKGYMAYSKP
ncbi:MAG: hypothetical protein ABI823_10365 [Bryobacteraceae bacterium]